jgi:hypothetical protein
MDRESRLWPVRIKLEISSICTSERGTLGNLEGTSMALAAWEQQRWDREDYQRSERDPRLVKSTVKLLLLRGRSTSESQISRMATPMASKLMPTMISRKT